MLEIIAPKENVDDTLLIIKNYFKSGDKVSKSDEIMDLETSKTVFSIEAEADGYIEYLVSPGTTVDVGQVIIRIHDTAFDPKEISNNETSSAASFDFEKRVISAKAQQFIFENNIDISHINKSFITLSDVDPSAKSIQHEKKSEAIGVEANLGVVAKPIGLGKQAEIKALSYVQSSGLVSTIFVNVDTPNIPKSENLLFKSSGSYLPVIAFEVSRLLKKYPVLNAYFENNCIMHYTSINIGIALDIDDGLKVYSVKNADALTLQEMEMSIGEGIYSYFRKTLTPNEVKGSTFTITDLSSFGVDRFVPLINFKQSAILGISSVDKKLDRFTLSLSFDHRITEGKLASLFLKDLGSAISGFYSSESVDQKI
jgi:pyruvate/2-oxoglutarate dehydrogenase complex dihydrolipoamide acyltransferase (E2) component